MSDLNITTTSLPPATIGEPYQAQLEVAGGTPPYRWDIVEGHMPPGLWLNAATGQITGTPDSPPPPNLLPAAASGFEDGTIGGWLAGLATSLTTLANSTTVARTGTRSLQVTTGAGATNADASVIVPTPNLTGTTVTFVAWIQPATAARISAILLQWQTAVGASVGGLLVGPWTATTLNGWTRLEFSNIVPATAEQVRMYVRASGVAAGDVFYLDDVLITPA